MHSRIDGKLLKEEMAIVEKPQDREVEVVDTSDIKLMITTSPIVEESSANFATNVPLTHEA